MENLHLPNLLSGSRIILAPWMFYCIYNHHWLFALATLLLAVATDLLDGYLARRLGQTSPWGGLLDHSSDAVFVSTSLAALATQQLMPWLLPMLVVISFSQYMLDSRALEGQALRTSRLGRYNGIAYFVLAGWPVGQYALALPLLDEALLFGLGWALCAATLVSMLDRLVALYKSRRG